MKLFVLKVPIILKEFILTIMNFEVGKALALVGENLSNCDVQKHWNAIQKDGIDYADFCNFISTLPE